MADLAGNRAEARASWLLDSLAPVTTLLVNGQPAPGAALTAAPTDQFSFSAQDAGTGVRETLFSLDGAAEQVFTGPFSLAVGAHDLSFRSRDQAGNLEAAKTAAITVAALGAFQVALDLKPETLNLASQGQFVSAHLEVTGSETAANVATGTVRVSRIDGRAVSPPIFIDPKGPVSLADDDKDGALELHVKFPRERLSALLPGDREVRVAVAGAFRSGALFEAEDGIRTLGKAITVTALPDDEGFTLVAAHAFPNPAKGMNPTIRLQTKGRADSVQIAIYNVFRELVHTADPGAPQRVDGRWTYDYSWSVAGVRTGVYVFRITARKAGFPEVRAVGRVAVIR